MLGARQGFILPDPNVLYSPHMCCLAPTSEFPHPLSGLGYDKGWRIENWYSYHVMDWVLLEGFVTSINNLRRSIGLEPVRAGEYGYSYVFDNKVWCEQRELVMMISRQDIN